MYLDQPEAVSGRVVADLRAGTLTGDIIERWTCTGDCRTSTGIGTDEHIPAIEASRSREIRVVMGQAFERAFSLEMRN